MKKTDLNSIMKSELQKWLELLLQLIDVTADQADAHLRRFIKGRGIIKDYQAEIREIVSGKLVKKDAQ